MSHPDSTNAETHRVDESWDRVITSAGRLRSFPLREVWLHRDLLYLLVKRDIIAFYKQTLLGPLWFFVQPALTSAIFVLVFGQIANLSTEGAPQFLFYLCGVTVWNYFAECINKTAVVFRENANLFGKVYFPRVLVPISVVIANLVRFLIQFTLFLIILVPYCVSGTVWPQWSMLLLPLLIANMALMGLAIGMICSSLTAKYRDLIFLLNFGVQLLMYVTPVVYPLSQVPDRFLSLMWLNPLTPLFEAVRHGFLDAGQISGVGLLASTAFAVALTTIAFYLFELVQLSVVDTV